MMLYGGAGKEQLGYHPLSGETPFMTCNPSFSLTVQVWVLPHPPGTAY